jgi:peptidylprolyl isomerase
MAEDPVYLTEEGWRFFRPRQETFYLIAPAPARAAYPDGLYAELHTNKGLIVVALDFERAPLTVANFVGLAEGTMANAALPPGAPFFDGSFWHRVVPGHVIQAGMALAGSAGPGYQFPNEHVPGLSHNRAGMVGMANAGPHTNASQFYITLGDRSYLDGLYTLFGEVVQGLDVVQAVVQGDWIEHVRIIRMGMKARAFKSDTAAFAALRSDAELQVLDGARRKTREDRAVVRRRWPGAKPTASGAFVEVMRAGRGVAAAAGQPVAARYAGVLPDGRRIASSAEDGRPVPGTTAQPFQFVPGTSSVNPAIDEALSVMTPGEKRRVITLGDSGYTGSGYFSPPKPGEARFVIAPGTMIVYEVEVLRVGR